MSNQVSDDPRGFVSLVGRIGVREDRDDCAIIATAGPAASAAMFTQSRFCGASVTVSRQAAGSGHCQGVVAISGNSNVATPDGESDALEIRQLAADLVGIPTHDMFIASTGVIGRRYPVEAMRQGLAALGETGRPAEADFDAAAAAIMTTDTHPKIARAECSQARLVGIAKGVGMIEPNMATMLTFFFTDAQISPDRLDAIFRRVVATTFNAVSIDTDTSTSDSATIIANGLAGPVDETEFEKSLHSIALSLVKDIAADGEGATKLIEVIVTGARDNDQAKRVGKAIVNSPLVKTAVHGCDPNWGRVAMAIGKLHEDRDIDPASIRISFGDIESYPTPATPEMLSRMSEYLAGNHIVIQVSLGIGEGEFSVYGCDLTEGYIRINADYTT